MFFLVFLGTELALACSSSVSVASIVKQEKEEELVERPGMSAVERRGSLELADTVMSLKQEIVGGSN